MRASFLTLPVTLAFLAPFPGMAQEAPRVLVCVGLCYLVDANEVRTPAPKGTRLLPGQHLETGPGGYAQVKLGPDAIVALGESGRVGFDDRAVILDTGRIRVVGGEALGKPNAQPVELRTGDGSFALQGADIEVRKPRASNAMPALTYMKVNAGDARLLGGQNDVIVPKEGVQGFSAGKAVRGPAISIAEIAPRSRVAAAAPIRGLITPLPRITLPIPPIAVAPIRLPIIVPLPTKPVLLGGERLMLEPIRNVSTGEITTLNTVIQQRVVSPVLATPSIKPPADTSTVLRTGSTTFTRVR